MDVIDYKTDVMGITIDLVNKSALATKIGEYLSSDYMSILFYASTKNIVLASEDPSYRESLESSDLLLSCDEMLFYKKSEWNWRKSGLAVNFKEIGNSIMEVSTEAKTFFVLGDQEEMTERYIQTVTERYPIMKPVGSFWDDWNQNSELVLNQINSVAPDILISIVPSPLQEKWLVENRTKLNAKLCLGLGEIADTILLSFHMKKGLLDHFFPNPFYRQLSRNRYFKNIASRRIFKIKYAQYTNKKLNGR